jgi:hypothetical protein
MISSIDISRKIDLVDDEEKEVVLSCDYEIKNDGIGWYELWGSREFDAGRDYVDISSVKWDRSLYTQEENDIIRKWVDANTEALEKDIDREVEEMNEPDYDL